MASTGLGGNMSGRPYMTDDGRAYLGAHLPKPALCDGCGPGPRNSSLPGSGFRGVQRDVVAGKWRVRLHLPNSRKTRFGGYFTDPREAARAYDALALKVIGPAARTNFPAETSANSKSAQAT